MKKIKYLLGGLIICIITMLCTLILAKKGNNGADFSPNKKDTSGMLNSASGVTFSMSPNDTSRWMTMILAREMYIDTSFMLSGYVRSGNVPASTINVYQGNPSDPTGTTSGAGVMMGLSGAFTPTRTGRLMIVISSNISNNTLGSGAQMKIRYGTGSAPINGAALSGTVTGNTAQVVNPSLALLVAGSNNATCNSIVTGLTLNTAYWIDLSLLRLTSGTANIASVSISIIEI